MNDSSKPSDKDTWAIGGGILIGVGAGFFYLQQSALAFVGCIILGLGAGLVACAILAKFK